jgi:hypothetical protein
VMGSRQCSGVRAALVRGTLASCIRSLSGGCSGRLRPRTASDTLGRIGHDGRLTEEGRHVLTGSDTTRVCHFNVQWLPRQGKLCCARILSLRRSGHLREERMVLPGSLFGCNCCLQSSVPPSDDGSSLGSRDATACRCWSFVRRSRRLCLGFLDPLFHLLHQWRRKVSMSVLAV